MSDAMSSEKTMLVPNLRFPEFRNATGWTSEKLGSKTRKVGSGITPKGGEKHYKESGRPFVRSQNIGWGELLLDDVAFIDEETHNSFRSTQIASFDVLLNITGASIGRSAVADVRIDGGNVNQHVCIIRVKRNELIPYFLNQHLISYDGQKQIESFQAGGNRQGLNFEQIRTFQIPLPTIFAEQQKIADCLGSLDELIAAQARKVDALKTHKKGLMQQLFPREGETQPRLRFPEFQNAGEWEVQPLGKLVELQSGFAFSSDNFGSNGRKLVTPKNFTKHGHGNFDETVSKYTTEEVLERFVCKPGDLLVLLTDLTPTCELLGKPLLLEDKDGIVLLNQRVVKIEPSGSELETVFLKYVFLSESYLNRIIKTATGSTVKHSSNRVLQEMPLFHPATSEQQRIADCLTSLDDLITAATEQLETLKTHKKGLMQQLFPSVEAVES